MNSSLLALYHHLPAPMRSVAASLRGLYLRNWRFGRETQRLIESARERDYWSAAEWSSWREERLAFILHRAATQVPFYREQWAKRRSHGDGSSWEYLENWPTLDKDNLRTNPRAFVADDSDPERMFCLTTSGTTGKPVTFWRSRKTIRLLYSLAAARTTGWHGISLSDRWARLGGQLITPVSQRKPPFWVWNAALNQLYMSAYHLAPDLIPYYLDALARYRVSYLLGYSSALCTLAQEALRLGRRDLKMRVAISSSEPLFRYQREVIAEAFQCPVRETYGMAETAAAASECQEGSLHLWPEVGAVEITDRDESVTDALSGSLLCTGLLNEDMPLVRYSLGDRGSLPIRHSACSCGRTLPLLSAIEGRTDDVLYTKDGRAIGRLSPVVRGDMPIREAQIIQESLGHVRVRYVPSEGFTRKAASHIIDELRARMGDVEVTLEQVEEVPRSASGKFRYVVCDLPSAQRDAVVESKRALIHSTP